MALKFAAPTAQTGQAIAYSYSASGIRRRDRVVFQRRVGTAGVFRSARNLKNGSGSGQTVVKTQGANVYRVAVLRRRRVVASTASQVTAYSDIPLSRIRGEEERTAQVGSALFRYAARSFFNGGDYCFLGDCTVGTQLAVFELKDSSCRSLSLNLAVQPDESMHAVTPANVTVVSERAEPVSTTIPGNTTTHLNANVSGDSKVNLAYDETSGDALLLLNGTASCSTANGSTSPTNDQ